VLGERERDEVGEASKVAAAGGGWRALTCLGESEGANRVGAWVRHFDMHACAVCTSWGEGRLT